VKRRQLLSLALSAASLSAVALGRARALPEIQVYKNPSCGCCSAWVEHLRSAGFGVRVTEVADTSIVRRRAGLPDKFASCHTAVVSGYVVEGHVPAHDIQRLLTMRPLAIGLAVPGMPAGSPGMETGARRDPYRVLLVDAEGGERVFSSYR
jgi:hypothetical protein